MVLLSGGGANMPAALRPAAVLLQLAALVPFGGRTALLLTLAMTALWCVPRIVRVLRGARMPLPAFAALAVGLPLLIIGIGLFSVGGFFDVIIDRFVDDLHGHEHTDRIADDVATADASGVAGTPSFFINGRRHQGAYDVDTLSRAVRTARGRARLKEKAELPAA